MGKKAKNKVLDEIKNFAGIIFFHFRGKNEEGVSENERVREERREGKGMCINFGSNKKGEWKWEMGVFLFCLWARISALGFPFSLDGDSNFYFKVQTLKWISFYFYINFNYIYILYIISLSLVYELLCSYVLEMFRLSR